MSCSPYFNLNSTTAELESKILSVGDLFDLQNDSAKRFDRSFLLTALAELQTLVALARPEYNYPMLYDRFDSGPIGVTEYADFLVATGTTQDMIEALNPNQLTIAAIQYLENMDTYYTNNFASSTDSFCTIFSGILNQIFDIISTVKNVIGAILNIKTLIEGLIDTLKKKLFYLVTQLINQVSECLGSIKGIANTVRQTADFFSDLNMQTLKDTVNNVIESASNKFANITQQNIDYLVYRFCQLSNAVEQFMRSPLTALQNSLQSCTNIKNVLTNASNEFSLSAIAAGAFRMNDDNIASIKDRLAGNLNNRADPGLDPAGRAKPGRWYTRPPTQEEINIAIAIKAADRDQLRSGSHPGSKWFDFSTIGGSFDNIIDDHPEELKPGIGVKGLEPEILILGMRVSEKLGKRLSITSGKRTEEYNFYIREAAIKRYPNDPRKWPALTSLHITGLALDVSRSSFGEDFESGEKFIKAASEEGAMGIGAYTGPDNNFIHIDIGDPRRTWPTSAEGPLAHKDTLKLHVADQFRIGASPDIDQLNADVLAAIRA